ncbi:hypothetical protein BB558_001049 [Smittium angustum]|uniref:SURP motif domain-containing protein n=1 Tax=Smittium angustum TaxID=133377 RepID=A0A2U1JCP4_SMIAN|nr:hypothetical protein BB558_001049 [Smittium angustum]
MDNYTNIFSKYSSDDSGESSDQDFSEYNDEKQARFPESFEKREESLEMSNSSNITEFLGKKRHSDLNYSKSKKFKTVNENLDLYKDILIFGYEAKLFPKRRNEYSEINLERYLIPYSGNHQNSSILIDRFDTRHIIENQEIIDYLISGQNVPGHNQNCFIVKESCNSKEKSNQKTSMSVDFLDKERYQDLDPEDESICTMSYGEQVAYKEEKEKRKLLKNKQYSYNYNTETEKDVDIDKNKVLEMEPEKQTIDEPSVIKKKGKSFAFGLQIPDDMEIPDSQREFNIIEKTAKFVSNKESQTEINQLEIKLMGKQGTNPDFFFLSKSNKLNKFYNHLKFLIRMEKSSNNELYKSSKSIGRFDIYRKTETKILSKALSPPIELKSVSRVAKLPENIRVPENNEIRSLITSTALFIASKQDDIEKAEIDLRILKSSSRIYSFLSSTDEFNKYYRFYRDSLIEGKTVLENDQQDNTKRESSEGSIQSTEMNDTNSNLKLIENQENNQLDNLKLSRRKKMLEFLKSQKHKQNG